MAELDNITVNELICEARKAREKAYAPYSEYRVGAAILTSSDNHISDDNHEKIESFSILTGCNIENASYPAGICAERAAVSNALINGSRRFKAIAIVGGGESIDYGITPCGICRQVLREFVKPEEFQVILITSDEKYEIISLSELLPRSFGPENLDVDNHNN